MPMKNVFVVTLAALAATLSGCAGRQAAPKSGDSAVRLGYMPNVTHAAVLIGLAAPDGGYATLAPEIALEAKAFNAGPAIVEALRAGALDAAVIGPGPAINAFWRGKDIVVLTNLVDGGSVLVARAGSNIKRVEDLAGRKVAVPQIGNTQDVLLRYQMAQKGLRPSSDGGQVAVQPIENANVLPLFERGQLDAACVPEPWASRLEREAGATVVLAPADLFRGGRYSAALLVARKEFVTQHPEAARALVRATNAMTARIAKDPQAATGALVAGIQSASGKKVPEADIRRALKRCRFTPDIGQQDLNLFANLLEVAGYEHDATASLDGILWK